MIAIVVFYIEDFSMNTLEILKHITYSATTHVNNSTNYNNDTDNNNDYKDIDISFII